MISNVQLALLLAAILSIANYILESGIKSRIRFMRDSMISLIAGISIAYVFLDLFPTVYQGTKFLSDNIFVFMLLGFTAYHLIEKLIYKHAARNQIAADIETEHTIILFTYHLAIGILLMFFIRNSLKSGLLFFVPVSLHVLLSELPGSHKFRHPLSRLLFAGAPILGALTGFAFSIPNALIFALLGLITGLLLFLEVRETIPQKKRGSPLFFVTGMLLFIILLLATKGF